MAPVTGSSAEVTLLFTCVGRRVELLQAFRASAKWMNISLRLIGADSDITAPALSACDVSLVVPPVSDPDYVGALKQAVTQHGVRALIPTIDTDLAAISSSRADFETQGCIPLIAMPDVIHICRDKGETYRFLKTHHIDTPQTWNPSELMALAQKPFPLFIKPRTGSASQWVQKIEDEDALNYFLRRIPDPIIQEFVEGVEHTLDAYVGLDGEVRCVVPRARWQVRGGEVSKGVVIKDAEVMTAGKHVVESLGDSCRGLVTLQCIVTPQRRIRFIEINPRFGGGAPLSIAAGADFPGWLFAELRGQRPQIVFDGFQEGICMLRYDWSVFLAYGPTAQPVLGSPLTPFPEFLKR